MKKQAKLRRFSEKEQEIIINRYKVGESIESIRKDFPCDGSTIARLLKRNNIVVYPQNTRTLNEELIWLAAAQHTIESEYLSGKSMENICSKYGLNIRNVRRYLKSKNISIRFSNGGSIRREVNHNLIYDLYVNQRLLVREIVTLTGISGWCVGRSLKEQGIDTLERRKLPKTDFQLYSSIVKRYSKQSLANYSLKINPNNHKRSKFGYHLDHIFSIFEGFKNNIPPYIIGHWTNLQVIDYKSNIQKSTNSHKHIDNLINDYFGNI
jgi:hypothetical protein